MRDYRNRTNPHRVDFRAGEDEQGRTVIEVKPRGCPPSRYVAEADGGRIRFRELLDDGDGSSLD